MQSHSTSLIHRLTSRFGRDDLSVVRNGTGQPPARQSSGGGASPSLHIRGVRNAVVALALLVASASISSAAVTVTATNDDGVPAATRKLQGDTVNYTTVISNTAAIVAGNANDATGVMLTNPTPLNTVDRSQGTITVHAAKRGNPRMNLQDGRSVAAASASLSGARPLSLASGDLNVDGYPDLVTGYASANGSFVTVRLGNPEAFGPTRPETIEAIKNGQFHDSFLPDVALLPVPEAPEFLAVGDFDRDGRLGHINGDPRQRHDVPRAGRRKRWFLCPAGAALARSGDGDGNGPDG